MLTHARGSSDGSGQEDSQSESNSIGSSSDDDDEEPPRFQSYNLLLQSFQSQQKEDRPAKKRRRLNDERDEDIKEITHSTAQDAVEEDGPEEDGSASDESVAEAGADESVADEEDFEAAASEDEEDISDPFDYHFGETDEKTMKQRINAAEEGDWDMRRVGFPGLANCIISQPRQDEGNNEMKRTVKSPKEILGLKRRLISPIQGLMPEFDSLQQALAPNIFEYRDILFGARKVANAEGLRNLACLHALNHVMKRRDRVLKNNARLSKDQGDVDSDIRDQGFTRPKILFLLETRQSCARYIDTITALSEPEQQENKKRFLDSFSSSEQRFGEDKPEDFRELFEGNDDNAFRLGIKFTRKTLKFFSKFYASDMIFASPLGLRRAIGAMNEEEEAKKRDYDFLSSIEVVILDQTDAMLMQNWEHVEYIFEHLNQQPKDSHDTDFSRVRHWYLDGNAKFLRQTIVFSAFLTPSLNALSSRHMRNIAGKIKFQPRYSGAIAAIDFPFEIKQSFSRFFPASHTADPDARFTYFTSTIVPLLLRFPKPSNGSGLGALIFVPSYFDFVRLRNYFSTSTETTNISFGAISEYTPPSDVRRARAHFMSGRHSALLYTERAHHFRRYRLKGVKRVIMYSLPENPTFYHEIVGGFLGDSALDGKVREGEASVRVVFSRFDAMKLERVVGSKRVQAMVSEKTEGDTFDFV
ncbi:U3 snoRNA-associated protein 25 [Rhizodiscina lignyota]|uniref:U3 small nucleolar RNA-associated protein 25 n=1 Tax=Rhizodiscina lignyota TaxID=1504668 RepID=A0A9P4IJH9_9PEZI|nr:U3 snoRNA-associated protein 25 [Rhizodiscina lignyota]